ncbi:MAG TPA: pilus assembly protein TadG-related protein [Anaerolineales bacterium]|nr:pilus assembly protein TadG-related protein [Anaerolineales bacterium]
MSHHHYSSEHGQNMIIIAVLMVVLIGLSALVIDGGLGYAKRRQAQNAADAAALAGADIMCGGGSSDAVRATAREYLLSNGASEPALGDIIVSGSSGMDNTITVNASVTHQTFFAGIFGAEDITATASATAGCFVPCISTILPVAWACHPPVGELPGEACEIVYSDLEGTDPEIYVVMDGIKVGNDVIDACQDPATGLPENALDCDVNPEDGIIDVFLGGERSWMDLNGGGGGGLAGWVEDGFPYPINLPTWFAAEEGDKVNVFQATESRLGEIVLLPVFDNFCPVDPRTSASCTYGPVDIFPGTPGFPGYNPARPGDTAENPNQTFFRVASISAFRITCIQAPSVPLPPGVTTRCPGLQSVIDANPDIFTNNGIINSTVSIEGYFVQDYGGSGACEGPYAGVYTVYLK